MHEFGVLNIVGAPVVLIYPKYSANMLLFVGLAYQGKDIVFRFIIEYNSLRDFGPEVVVVGLFFFI